VITADDLRKSASSSLPEILAQFGLIHIRDNAGTPNQQVDLRASASPATRTPWSWSTGCAFPKTS